VMRLRCVTPMGQGHRSGGFASRKVGGLTRSLMTVIDSLDREGA
jgi:hypothetical protein